ncbi:DoxX family protein [Candidatus Nomurabacteria bacterium]|nr:DoxX family protein [Candidatus Nomurabacteria bacterium]
MKKAIKYLFILIGLITFGKASAHVGYVIETGELQSGLGPDFHFLFSALSERKNIVLIIITALVFLFVYWLSHKNYFVHHKIININQKVDTYREYIPWILRLSLGIALIGAGTSGVLISPLLPIEGFALVQTAIGFMLLAGFILPFSTTLVLGLYVIAAINDHYILGNLEFIAAALALFLMDDAKPGVDDILSLPKLNIKNAEKYLPFILRIGIGGAMIYLALYEKIFNPHITQIVVRNYNLTSAIHVSEPMWVLAVGIIELIVGLFLFIGFKTRLTAVIAFFVLCVTFFFFKEDIFSHVTLFGVLSALFITGGGYLSIDNRYKTAPDSTVSS